MPRVNRDLQRRLAARRERERRRPPTERRYTVDARDGANTVAEPVDTEALDGAPEMLPATANTTAARASATPRGATARPSPKPFSAYRAEYAYVGADLRRVALVIGSLLAVLIVLHFIIAR